MLIAVNRVYIWGILLMWQMLLVQLHAQSLQLNTRTFTTDDGLSHNTVYSIHQDREGFLWIGTKYGLNRYDGHNFIWFTKQSHQLVSDQVVHIYQASNHQLWLIDQVVDLRDTLFKSIELFDTHSFTSRSLESVLPDSLPFAWKNVKAVKALDTGALLISTPTKTYSIDDKEGIQMTPLAAGMVLMESIGKDNIWSLHQGQLVQMDITGTVRQSFGMDSLNRPYNIKQDVEDTYWASIEKRIYTSTSRKRKRAEFWRIHQGKKEVLPITFEYIFQQEIQILPLNAQPYLLITNQGSLNLVDKKTGETLQTSLFLDKNPVGVFKPLIEDQAGTIWFGYREGLVAMQLKKPLFQNLLTQNTTLKKSVRGIGQTDSTFYINTNRDCFFFDLAKGSKSIAAVTDPQFQRPRPFPMFTDGQGKLWTASDQIFRIGEGGKIKQILPAPDPPIKRIWNFFQDKAGTWWLGNTESLFTYHEAYDQEPVIFHQYNAFSSLKRTQKWHFAEDQHGIWIASYNGLFLLDAQHGIIARFAEDEAANHFLPSTKFNHLYTDQEDIMWLLTADAGLIRVDQASLVDATRKADYTQLTRIQGFPSNELYACLEDHNQHLWISSAHGLIQLDKQSLEINAYFEEDGLSNNEFNRLSYFKAPDGRMYFGGINGLNSFDPHDFYQKVAYDPPLKVAKAFIFSGEEKQLIDETKQFTEQARIDYYPDDTYLKLQFSLQDYFQSDRIQYEYQIKGLTDRWTSLSGNELQLSGLPYGRYRLKVRAQGPDKRFSTDEIDLPLSIHRPFYLKTWFLLLMLFALMLSLWQAYQWRIRSFRNRQRQLEQMVADRTQKIVEDKQLIEQQAEELKALDEMKSRFFANISHELRTPLTLILGPLSGMLRQKSMSSSNKSSLSMMQSNGKHLLNRINELLELSRFDANKQKIRTEVVELQPFLKGILKNFEASAQLKKIALKASFEADTKLSFFSDKDKIEKIIANFLSNALKFTPEGGEVEVKIGRGNVGSGQLAVGSELDTKRLSTNKLPTNLLFTVSDTGIGIPADELEKVFDRFYQTEISDQAGGTGIGLSLAKELAHLLGGKVWAESEMGKGSRFYFELPVEAWEVAEDLQVEADSQKIMPQPTLPPIAEPSPKQEASILLTEDHPDMRQYIRSVLADYEVITAAHGAEALEILHKRQEEKKPIHLIISDIMMPVMDGLTLLEKLKGNDHYRQIPVVMLTARSGLESKLQALRIGIDDYLTKPFDEEELRASIANLLRNYRNREVLLPAASAVLPAESPAPTHAAADLKWLQEVEQHIISQLDDSRFTLTNLADQLAISTRRLQQKIKALTGLTPKQYQREIQLEFARRLLEEGAFSTVAEVSFRVGFEDQHYFSTLFKKRFGKKPSAY